MDSTYLPEEVYLNALGDHYLREDRVPDALDIFELAMTLYPQSVNTYQRYGGALHRAGEKEKALKIFTEGYELAKKTGHKNLADLAAHLKNLKEGTATLEQAAPPPPPPPAPQR